MASFRGFTSILTVVCANTRMIWLFTIESKIYPVIIVRFYLTTLKKEQYPCRLVRFDEERALSKSTYVTNLLVDYFSTYMENTGGDAS